MTMSAFWLIVALLEWLPHNSFGMFVRVYIHGVFFFGNYLVTATHCPDPQPPLRKMYATQCRRQEQRFLLLYEEAHS